MNTQEILNHLETEESISLIDNDDNLLDISFRKFFTSNKTFLFVFNGKAIDDCKTKRTAIKKINNFVNRGFFVWNE